MAKKLGVIVRDRPGEALRMSIGLTLNDDEVYVIVTEELVGDSKKYLDDEVKDLVSGVYTLAKETNEDEGKISEADLAAKLLEFDNVLAY